MNLIFEGVSLWNPFPHIIGGLNVSVFSIVGCKANVFSNSMACTIVDSKDRYFQGMNCADPSQINPNQASDLLRS